MRLLFLDIDGVCNSGEFIATNPPLSSGMYLDSKLIANVQTVCDRTGAKVVISSTWRAHRKMPKLRNILRLSGLTAPIIGRTPEMPSRVRGEEIQHWLVTMGTDVEGIVILDDDADMGTLFPWLVRTSAVCGFTSADADRAIDILSRPAPSR